MMTHGEVGKARDHSGHYIVRTIAADPILNCEHFSFSPMANNS